MSHKNKFVPVSPLNTAVLFIVFNRFNTTKQVFESIRKARPPRLYIASDGPRLSRKGEDKQVYAIRNYLANNIDWECELKTLFQDKNLGCKYGPSEAITWFFNKENEEKGIIIEDDCLPSQSFFWYCENLLEKYKNSDQIMQINGSCFIKIKNAKDSYYFSRYHDMWGWATWRRAWDLYRPRTENFEEDFKNILHIFNSRQEEIYWYNIFKKYNFDQLDAWDYPWMFSAWLNNGIAIYPTVNMIKNVGFGNEATHTKSTNVWFRDMVPENINSLVHPDEVSINSELDILNFKKRLLPEHKIIRIFRRMLDVLNS